MGQGSTQHATRYVQLGFEALNDIIDLSVVGSCNRTQVGFHNDAGLERGMHSSLHINAQEIIPRILQECNLK